MLGSHFYTMTNKSNSQSVIQNNKKSFSKIKVFVNKNL